MILMMIIFVILVYRLAVNTDRHAGAIVGDTALATETPAAVDILNARFASGEIDKATYRAMRREVA